jgi:ribokinase
LPKVGETISGSLFQTTFGGKGANQAVQCARLDVPTAFIGCVGRDTYGQEYLQALTKENIDVQYTLQTTEKGTGIASIWVDEQGNNSIIIIGGANGLLTADHVTSSLTTYLTNNNNNNSTPILVFQNEISVAANIAGLNIAKQYGLMSILNPAPFTRVECTQLLTLSPTILCLNEIELQMLFDTITMIDYTSDSVLGDLVNTRIFSDPESEVQIVIATLGKLGAVLITKSPRLQVQRFVAPIVDAVSTVGAGDSFIGK